MVLGWGRTCSRSMRLTVALLIPPAAAPSRSRESPSERRQRSSAGPSGARHSVCVGMPGTMNPPGPSAVTTFARTRQRDRRRKSGRILVVDSVLAIWLDDDGVEHECSCRRERYVLQSADRECRAALFVHSVLCRSFDAAAADWREAGRIAQLIWPPRAGQGRNHSAALVAEGWRVLLYESRGLGGVELLRKLREYDGLAPPWDSHRTLGPSDRNWLSKRRCAVRAFATAIVRHGGAPPRWLIPDPALGPATTAS